MYYKYKVIYSVSRLLEWVDVAENLKNKYGWVPVYWIAHPSLENNVNRKFPNIIFHNTFHAMRSILPKETHNLIYYPLDKFILEKMSYYETVAIKLMDRMDMGYSFSYLERKRLYHKQLMYWNNVIEYFKPDLFFLTETPHTISDYVLYALCIEKNVRTLMYTPTSVNGLIYVRRKINEVPVYLKEKYDEKISNLNVSIEIEKDNHLEYFKRVSGSSQNAEPEYMKRHRQKELKSKYKKILYFSKWPSLLKRAVKIAIELFKYERDGDIPLKKQSKNIEDSYLTGWERRLYSLKSNRYKKNLFNYYTTMCEEPNLTLPYIYVALHYQPEKTTLPEGGVYVDQDLMINLLSINLPNNWVIYVKEHPTQFFYHNNGHQARNTAFYKNIKSIPNVKFVSVKQSSFELIDNSQAVATVTGTVGWEALIRKKPVLVFGYAWYRFCEGVFYIANSSDAKNAINLIEEGYKVNEEKVKAVIKTLEECCVEGYLNPSSKQYSNIGYKEHVQSFLEGVNKYLNKI